MGTSISFQAVLFAQFIIFGILVAIMYDFFYSFRKVFRLKTFGVCICDFLFFVISITSFFIAVINLCDGENRLFIIFGIILGMVFYSLTLTKYIKFVFLAILKVIYKNLSLFYRLCKKINNKLIKKNAKKTFIFRKNKVK